MSTASALLAKSKPRLAEASIDAFDRPVADAGAVTDAAIGAAADAASAEVRVYRGRSIDELIPRIEAELGADAIVVRRRRGLEGGIGGFFQRPFVEVEAKPGTPRIDLYDEDPQPAYPAPPRPAGAYVTDTLATIAAAGAPQSRIEDPPLLPSDPPTQFRELTPDTFGAALAEAARTAEPSFPVSLPQTPNPTIAADPFDAELEQLDRGMTLKSAAAPTSPPRHARARAAIELSLADVGMGEELIEELIDAAIAHTLPFAPRIGLARAVHGALVARIPRNQLLPTPSATVAVVGPGGSGKTSCCAALLNTYRRAAALPASCATIMPLVQHEEHSLLLSPHIMEPLPIAAPHARQVLDQARRQGLLLLDMPPLSPADRSAIRQIGTLLAELQVDRVVVALPATLGAKAAAQLLQALLPLRASGLAITHADETDQLGVAVEAACRFGLAPEYLLDRGRVRGGLTRIDPTQLADRLLP
jgi:hypothetical protein